MKLLRYLWARLREPSTHAGIAGVLAGLAQFNPAICWLAAVEGCVAFLLRESAAPPANLR
jgi:hypothetical protein